MTICKFIASIHDQVQLMILLLGRYGITGTAFAVALMIAYHFGRRWAASHRRPRFGF